MKLTNKTSAYTVALLILMVSVMGVYQHFQIRQAAEDTYRIYMSAIVDTFVHRELAHRHGILREAGLERFPQYVDRYVEEILEAADNLARRESGALYLLKGKKTLSTPHPSFTRPFSELNTIHDFSTVPSGFNTVGVSNGTGVKKRYVAYWTSYSDWDMTAVFIKSDDDLRQAISGLETRFITASVLLLALSIFLVWMVYSRLVVKPISRLANAARKIARKELSFSISSENSGELTLLAEDMEHMRNELQQNQKFMDNWNERLQTEIANKTADIQRKQTELSDYNVKLQQSNKELEQFAYVASHDLQEPLRMISSFLSLLEKRYKGKLDDQADEYIFYAVDGAERLKRMITDLLAFSRVATHGAEFKPCDLNQCVKEAIRNLKLGIDEHKVSIETSNLPQVEGDPSQLTQLFQNLIDNAIKYRSTKTPCIQITAHQTDNDMCCLVEVKDNGIGIPDDYNEKAFMVFHRLHNDSDISGNGIGLAVCKKIVQRHNGEIAAKENIDGGTSISFSLRLAPKSEKE